MWQKSIRLRGMNKKAELHTVLTWQVSRTWLMKEMTIPSLTRQRQNVSRNCLLSENETVGSMNA